MVLKPIKKQLFLPDHLFYIHFLFYFCRVISNFLGWWWSASKHSINLAAIFHPFIFHLRIYFICDQGSFTPRVFGREWSGWILSESCWLSFSFSVWRPALKAITTKNKNLENAWSPACLDASRRACEKMEEKESKGNNERITDGTAERRPTKKSKSCQDALQPFSYPNMAIPTKFPCTSVKVFESYMMSLWSRIWPRLPKWPN